jgi:hypothetical protein
MNFHVLSMLYNKSIVLPLRKLYLFGPSVMQIGFWGGQPNSQICQSITTYSELFWQSNLQQCEDIIENKFTAFRVTIEVVTYFLFLYHISKGLLVLITFLLCRCRKKPPEPHIMYLTDVHSTLTPADRTCVAVTKPIS